MSELESSRAINVLFVCARNRWRSPTAEHIYANDPRLAVRSAGVSPQSPRQISERDLDWADLIVVMEREHAARIRQRFKHRDELPPVRSLEIPDLYERMDPELIQLIKTGTEGILAEFGR